MTAHSTSPPPGLPANPAIEPAGKWSWTDCLQWKYLLLGGFWIGLFIGTHLPKIPQPMEKVSDKTMHGGAFVGLALLLAWATFRPGISLRRHFLSLIVLIAIYGALDEILQIPVGRHCDINDWLADMGGALVGLTAFHTGVQIRNLFRSTKPAGISSQPIR